MVHDQKIGQLHQFDHFGEASLVQNGRNSATQTRNASVVADSATVQVMSLSASSFQALMEDGTIDQASMMSEIDQMRRKREARTRWGVARRGVWDDHIR